MEGVKQTKVKYTHSGHTLRHHLNINNENQDYEIGTVFGGVN
jgi:hypothetical protein